MQQISIYLSPELHTFVERTAERECRSISGQIKHWVVEAAIIALSSGVLWIVILSLSTMSRSGSGLLWHGHDEPAQLGRSLSGKRRVGSCAEPT